MDVYVARQPIFNRHQRTYGYELLFRNGLCNAFPDIEGSTASSRVLSDSFLSIGIENITGGKKAFINFTQDLIVKKIPLLFPRDSIIVEILEEVDPSEEVMEACGELSQKGYGLALDDFSLATQQFPLIPLAQIVKVDFRMTPAEGLQDLIHELAPYPARLLAEKVETHEEFEQALDMGFEYFQGYFFSKPQVLEGRDISPSHVQWLQIMAEVNKEDFSIKDLEKLISADVSISYKLLRYINSAYFRRIQEVSSIKQAIVLLGEHEVRRFISVLAMADLACDKPHELMRTSIVRAKLCELLAKSTTRDVDEAELFTLGLFSLIDAIMEKLPLSEATKGALVEKTGKLSPFLELTICYETGDWQGFRETLPLVAVPDERLPGFYQEAVAWADRLTRL